jgi:hypothetical protein
VYVAASRNWCGCRAERSDSAASGLRRTRGHARWRAIAPLRNGVANPVEADGLAPDPIRPASERCVTLVLLSDSTRPVKGCEASGEHLVFGAATVTVKRRRRRAVSPRRGDMGSRC